jgi:putative addiction module killer protein
VPLYQIEEYTDKDGNSPFSDWLGSLDVATRARIAARVERFKDGNFGDRKSVGKGVHEARVHLGPGYRVYFGIHKGKLIILLVGGSKRGQSKDIKNAQMYLKDWKENN